jgi:hypothetical protein
MPGSQVIESLAVYVPEPVADRAMETSVAALLALVARRSRARRTGTSAMTHRTL